MPLHYPEAYFIPMATVQNYFHSSKMAESILSPSLDHTKKSRLFSWNISLPQQPSFSRQAFSIIASISLSYISGRLRPFAFQRSMHAFFFLSPFMSFRRKQWLGPPSEINPLAPGSPKACSTFLPLLNTLQLQITFSFHFLTSPYSPVNSFLSTIFY